MFILISILVGYIVGGIIYARVSISRYRAGKSSLVGDVLDMCGENAMAEMYILMSFIFWFLILPIQILQWLVSNFVMWVVK